MANRAHTRAQYLYNQQIFVERYLRRIAEESEKLFNADDPDCISWSDIAKANNIAKELQAIVLQLIPEGEHA